MTLSLFLADSANDTPCGRTYPRRRAVTLVRETDEALDDAEEVDTEDTPEQDRFDERLAVSGVGRRFGEGEGEGPGECAWKGTLVKATSESLLMAGRRSEYCVNLGVAWFEERRTE